VVRLPEMLKFPLPLKVVVAPPRSRSPSEIVGSAGEIGRRSPSNAHGLSEVIGSGTEIGRAAGGDGIVEVVD